MPLNKFYVRMRKYKTALASILFLVLSGWILAMYSSAGGKATEQGNSSSEVAQLAAVAKHENDVKQSTCLCNGYADIVEKLLQTVVNISVTATQEVTMPNMEQFFFGLPFGGFEMPDFWGNQVVKHKTHSLGSGFIVSSNGLVATNYHVVKGADEIIITTNDNKEFVGKVLASDQKTDIALVQLKTKTVLPFVKFGSSHQSRIGDAIIAIGNPFGLGGTVTTGIISAKARHIDSTSPCDFIQTDAVLNRGSSGGPMFNLRGEVVGMNTAIFSSDASKGHIGIGFAIPSDLVSSVIDKLKTGKTIDRPWLGITYRNVDKKMVDALGFDEVRGVFVNSVTKNSPASKADIRTGDLILNFDDKKLGKDAFLPALMVNMKIGQKVPVIIWRYGKTITASVILEKQPNEVISNDKNDGKSDGITVQNLDSSARKRAKIFDDVNGVVITEIPLDIIRECGSIRRGDVITQIDDMEIKSVNDFTNAMQVLKKKGKKHAMFYVRRGEQVIIGPVQVRK